MASGERNVLGGCVIAHFSHPEGPDRGFVHSVEALATTPGAPVAEGRPATVAEGRVGDPFRQASEAMRSRQARSQR